MRFLADTSVFLELLLEQAKAAEARAFLAMAGERELFMSQFSLYSIGVCLFRRKRHDDFPVFLWDMIENAGVRVVTLSSKSMKIVADAARRFNLDFDDAYQYVVAQKYDLTIVSLDADFDRTERGRKTPAEVLAT